MDNFKDVYSTMSALSGVVGVASPSFNSVVNSIEIRGWLSPEQEYGFKNSKFRVINGKLVKIVNDEPPKSGGLNLVGLSRDEHIRYQL